MKGVMLIRSAFLAAMCVAPAFQEEAIVYRSLLDDLAPVETVHVPRSSGLLQFLSGLGSSPEQNERCASASLKTLSQAEADFRGCDGGGNRVDDFWTADVAGLYGVKDAPEEP